jgi:CHAT domain-containing protein/tetratricopeptide (TPR) repeat protein
MRAITSRPKSSQESIRTLPCVSVFRTAALLLLLATGSGSLFSQQLEEPAGTLQANPTIPEDVQRTLDQYFADLKHFRAEGNRYGEATTLHNIGFVYSNLGEKRKALEYLNQAVLLERAVGDKAGEAKSLNAIGLAYSDLGEKEKALEYYDQALPLRRAVGDRVGEGTTLNNIGMVYADLGVRERALQYYDQSLSLRRVSGDQRGEAITLNNIGAVYSDLGEKQRALEYYNQALPLRRAVGDKRGEAATLNNIGMVYADLGERLTALDHFNQALSLVKGVGDRFGEGKTLSNLGAAYATLGEFQKATDYYSSALSMQLQLGDPVGQATTLNNIATNYAELGEYERALENYDRALSLCRKTGDRAGESATLSNIGLAYLDLRKIQEALKYFRQALPLSRALQDRMGEARTLNNLGIAFSNLKENGQAVEYYTQALRLQREVGDSTGEAATLLNLASSRDSMNKESKLPEEYGEALALAIALKEPLSEGHILAMLMSRWMKARNPALAIFFGKQAVDIYQTVRGNLRRIDKELERSFATSTSGVYRRLADLLVTQGRLPEARDVLDLLKGEEYKDFVRGETEAKVRTVSFSLDEQESDAEFRQFKNEITAAGERWSQLRYKASRTAEEEKEYADLSVKIDRANQYMDRFFDQLYQQYATATNSQEANHRVSISQNMTSSLQMLVSELASGAVGLYTLVVENRYRVIVVTPTVMVDRETVITSDELRRRVFAFTEKLRNRSSNPLPEAQALYKVLVGPVENDLKGAHAQTLVWSLDDVLRYVPVAALHDGQRYLVERYRNVVITPASLTHLDKQPDTPNLQALALGIAKKYDKVSPVLAPLPNVEYELDAIVHDSNRPTSAKGLMPGLIELNDDFTEKTMADQLAQQKYRVVHIASHFVFKPGNDTDSYLLLGGKDVGGAGYHLTMQEVNDEPNLRQGFRGVDLLTLSACDTATSRIPADGKEVDGLATTVHKNGARAVIATLWKADDAATKQLMVDFYQHWIGTAGIAKAEALQQAQLGLLRGNISVPPASTTKLRYTHPYFWAPFILMGNWN